MKSEQLMEVQSAPRSARPLEAVSHLEDAAESMERHARHLSLVFDHRVDDWLEWCTKDHPRESPPDDLIREAIVRDAQESAINALKALGASGKAVEPFTAGMIGRWFDWDTPESPDPQFRREAAQVWQLARVIEAELAARPQGGNYREGHFYERVASDAPKRSQLVADNARSLAKSIAKKAPMDRTQGVDSKASGIDDDALLTVTGLIEAFGLPKKRLGALRKRLDRWRAKNPDSEGWIEQSDPKGRDARYLYRAKVARPLIAALTAST